MSTRSALEFSPGAAGPLLRGDDWRAASACRDVDPEIFYPPPGISEAMPAKQVCESCPVRRQCLSLALKTGDQWGIYGGLTYAERRPLMRGIPAGPGVCRKGLHPKTAENTYPGGACRPCKLARESARAAEQVRANARARLMHTGSGDLPSRQRDAGGRFLGRPGLAEAS